jgi:hypothetical protein
MATSTTGGCFQKLEEDSRINEVFTHLLLHQLDASRISTGWREVSRVDHVEQVKCITNGLSVT